ncbi:MAG: hypothetical protein BWY74_00898 [Firmicutes bacterium ADurb.Bin419]|nr:MAG: hypothetical protein BWY74_00898 [Firmicutes bacterium ADurb.Bin419]
MWGNDWYNNMEKYEAGENLKPTMVRGMSDIIDISSGKDLSFAIKKDGTVLCWAGNDPGSIEKVNGLSEVVAISATYGPTLALKKDGTVWTLKHSLDEEKTKKFDDVAENLISNYESGTYEKFVQKDKMDSVLVNNGKELVNAIKPNREIILKAGQTYNLTDALTKVKNLDYYEGEDSIYESATGEYRYSYEGKNREYVGVDGKGLVFTNIENLIIRSESDEPAYIKSKDIPHELRFECSKNIVIDGINIGHKTENIELFLADSVLFYYCKNIYINNSRIFEGDSSLSLIFVDDFVMNNSVIEDCGGGVTLSDSNNVLFKNSQFKNNVYFTLFTFETVDKVVFSACEINGNVANCGFACYEISPSITGVERTKPIVVDTVIKNNEIDYLQLNIDDIYFKNTIYNDNSFFRALYKYDLK